MIARRSLLKAIPALICAPAIVRVSSLMPVKAFTFSAAQDFDLLMERYMILPGSVTYIKWPNLFMDSTTLVAIQHQISA